MIGPSCAWTSSEITLFFTSKSHKISYLAWEVDENATCDMNLLRLTQSHFSEYAKTDDLGPFWTENRAIYS